MSHRQIFTPSQLPSGHASKFFPLNIDGRLKELQSNGEPVRYSTPAGGIPSLPPQIGSQPKTARPQQTRQQFSQQSRYKHNSNMSGKQQFHAIPSASVQGSLQIVTNGSMSHRPLAGIPGNIVSSASVSNLQIPQTSVLFQRSKSTLSKKQHQKAQAQKLSSRGMQYWAQQRAIQSQMGLNDSDSRDRPSRANPLTGRPMAPSAATPREPPRPTTSEDHMGGIRSVNKLELKFVSNRKSLNQMREETPQPQAPEAYSNIRIKTTRSQKQLAASKKSGIMSTQFPFIQLQVRGSDSLESSQKQLEKKKAVPSSYINQRPTSSFASKRPPNVEAAASNIKRHAYGAKEFGDEQQTIPNYTFQKSNSSGNNSKGTQQSPKPEVKKMGRKAVSKKYINQPATIKKNLLAQQQQSQGCLTHRKLVTRKKSDRHSSRNHNSSHMEEKSVSTKEAEVYDSKQKQIEHAKKQTVEALQARIDSQEVQSVSPRANLHQKFVAGLEAEEKMLRDTPPVQAFENKGTGNFGRDGLQMVRRSIPQKPLNTSDSSPMKVYSDIDTESRGPVFPNPFSTSKPGSKVQNAYTKLQKQLIRQNLRGNQTGEGSLRHVDSPAIPNQPKKLPDRKMAEFGDYFDARELIQSSAAANRKLAVELTSQDALVESPAFSRKVSAKQLDTLDSNQVLSSHPPSVLMTQRASQLQSQQASFGEDQPPSALSRPVAIKKSSVEDPKGKPLSFFKRIQMQNSLKANPMHNSGEGTYQIDYKGLPHGLQANQPPMVSSANQVYLPSRNANVFSIMNSQTNGSVSSYSNSGQKVFFNNQSCTGGSKSHGERVFLMRNAYGEDETSGQEIGGGHVYHPPGSSNYIHEDSAHQRNDQLIQISQEQSDEAMKSSARPAIEIKEQDLVEYKLDSSSQNTGQQNKLANAISEQHLPQRNLPQPLRLAQIDSKPSVHWKEELLDRKKDPSLKATVKSATLGSCPLSSILRSNPLTRRDSREEEKIASPHPRKLEALRVEKESTLKVSPILGVSNPKRKKSPTIHDLRRRKEGVKKNHEIVTDDIFAQQLKLKKTRRGSNSPSEATGSNRILASIGHISEIGLPEGENPKLSSTARRQNLFAEEESTNQSMLGLVADLAKMI